MIAFYTWNQNDNARLPDGKYSLFFITDNYFMITKDDTTHIHRFFCKCLFPVLYN